MSDTDTDDTETDEQQATDEPIDLSEMDPDEVSIEELENQDWTLGSGPAKELITFKGTTFLIEEPKDDDAILNLMAEAELGVGETSDRMYRLCSEAITAPKLTPERWRDFSLAERIGMMNRVSAALGLGDMMDFQELGQRLQEEG